MANDDDDEGVWEPADGIADDDNVPEPAPIRHPPNSLVVAAQAAPSLPKRGPTHLRWENDDIKASDIMDEEKFDNAFDRDQPMEQMLQNARDSGRRAAGEAYYWGITERPDETWPPSDILRYIDQYYAQWVPHPDTYGNTREGFLSYIFGLLAPATDGSVPLDAADFDEQYNLLFKNMLALSAEAVTKGLMVVDDSIPAHIEVRNKEFCRKLNAIRHVMWSSVNIARLFESSMHVTNATMEQLFSQTRVTDYRFNTRKDDWFTNLTDSQQICFWVQQKCRLGNFRKRGTTLYKEYITATGHHTHVWQKNIEIEDFVYKCVGAKEDNWEQYTQLTSRAGMAKWIADHLAKVHDPDLPWLEYTRGWWCTESGLVYIGDMKAYNKKKRKNKSAGSLAPGILAPSSTTGLTSSGVPEDDHPKFYKFMPRDVYLPEDHHKDIEDARNVPADIVAVNYLPVKFDIDLYIRQMEDYKKIWEKNHAAEIEQYETATPVEGKKVQHPRKVHDGYFMGIKTEKFHGIYRYQFEMRDKEREAIKKNIEQDFKGKGHTAQEIAVAQQAAVDTAMKEIEAIYEIQYLMSARLLYPVDKWRCQPFTLGTTATGKSTALRAIQGLFQDWMVTLIGNRLEKGFGLQAIILNESYVWMAMDVDRNFQMDPMDYNSIVGGEGVSIPVKNKTAISVAEFDVPGAMAGNEPPPFEDKGGAQGERTITAEFQREVRGKNTNLLGDIKNEYGPLLWKLIKCRTYYMNVHGAHLPYDPKHGWVPNYYRRTKGNLRANTNALEHFLTKGDVEVGYGYYCRMSDFKAAFNEFCNKERRKPAPLLTEQYLSVVFLKRDIEILTDNTLEIVSKHGIVDYTKISEEVIFGVAMRADLPDVTFSKTVHHQHSNQRQQQQVGGGSRNGQSSNYQQQRR